MSSNGFMKGALFGMLASAAVYTAVAPKKKMIGSKSTVGKSLKAVGQVVEDVMTMF